MIESTSSWKDVKSEGASYCGLLPGQLLVPTSTKNATAIVQVPVDASWDQHLWLFSADSFPATLSFCGNHLSIIVRSEDTYQKTF